MNDDRRPADWLVRLLVNLHFGRNWGMTVKWLWMVLGLIPAALFVTGFVTWYARVVKRRKPSASVPAKSEVIAELASECDVVITGSGD